MTQILVVVSPFFFLFLFPFSFFFVYVGLCTCVHYSLFFLGVRSSGAGVGGALSLLWVLGSLLTAGSLNCCAVSPPW